MTELIDTFIRPLVSSDLPYAVTGSVAAMAYGEPRLTNDIDLVLELKVPQIQSFIELFPEETFYLPPQEVIATEIVRGSRGHLNIISQTNLLKADVYFVSNDPLHRWAMDNIHFLHIDDLKIAFTPPEYLIIRKLEFFREGGSEKHIRDIAAMLIESAGLMDQEFLTKYIDALNLNSEFSRARNLSAK